MTTFRTLAAILAFALVAAVGGLCEAQTPAPSQPLPPEQMDVLVKAITASVLEKLKAEGVAPKLAEPKPAEPKPGRFDPHTKHAPDAFTIFFRQAVHVLRTGVPAFGHSVVEFLSALDNSPSGGRSRTEFVLLLAATAAVGVALEAMLRRLAWPVRAGLAASAAANLGVRSMGPLAALAAIDGACLLAAWLAFRVAVQLWFAGGTMQDGFAAAFLLSIFYWRLYVFAFRLVVRPGLPSARLCDMTDDEAARTLRLVSALLLFIGLTRDLYLMLAAVQAPADAIAAGRVIFGPLVLLFLLLFVFKVREGAKQWLVGLARAAPWYRFIGRHFVPIAAALFVALTAAQMYGAITKRLSAPNAVFLTLNLLIALMMFETLLQAAVRRLDSQLEGFTPADDRQRLPDVLARCARILVLIVAIVGIAESWVVNVLGLVDESAWGRLTRLSRSAGLTLFAAFVLWELFKYATEAYAHRMAQRNLDEEDGSPAAGAIAARFDTLMPMIRVTVAIIIAVIAALIALDDLGVNTAPLLAGASVIGLAISFGSQALVKDIVSGIFYLADDAFRVGEHIRCGQAEGTVEGFTLRSIRLRHPDGQIQVIPFGDLGQIANHSRDWAAAKFNLRFARDTDMEKLREATKKIGADLQAEPDLKADIIEPLRLHSVVEFTDAALVVRFKLKTRPGKAGVVQDRAFRRMLKDMPEFGITFAT